MKHKFHCLKSAASALALSLVLMGDITSPVPTPEDSIPFPEQIEVEGENLDPENGKEESLQPLSDMDEPVKAITEE